VTRWLRTPLVLALALVLAAAACGDDDDGEQAGGGGGGELTEIGSRLPEQIARARTLKVGSDIAYAPVEFFKEGTQEAQGIDVDICNAIVATFGGGFTCTFQNTTFDGLIPALNAKRFDVIMSALSDTKERQQAITLIDYFNAGTSILVRKGNPENIRSLDDLCGKTIGLQRGTTQEELANEQREKCRASGRELTVLTFDKDTDALLALKAGRSVADMNDFPVAAYNAKTSGNGSDFEVVGAQLDPAPYGIGVRKEDTALRDALQAGLRQIIANGTYDQVLQRWDVSQGALKTATINGG
jgi:polar amino acid transport system substrate-binding protein